MAFYTCNKLAATLLLSSMSALTAVHAANYTAILTGAQETPANNSPGIGASVITFDLSSHTLEINVAFGNLLGNTTAAHLHCCTAGPKDGTAAPATQLPTLSAFPLGVTSGVYSNSFNTTLASTWNPAFLASMGGSTVFAEAALQAGLGSGLAYFNIHTTANPAGEIRGFLTPAAPVPEPSSLALMGLGLPAVLLMAKRRRQKGVLTPA